MPNVAPRAAVLELNGRKTARHEGAARVFDARKQQRGIVQRSDVVVNAVRLGSQRSPDSRFCTPHLHTIFTARFTPRTRRA
jgi:hypothetical protein